MVACNARRPEVGAGGLVVQLREADANAPEIDAFPCGTDPRIQLRGEFEQRKVSWPLRSPLDLPEQNCNPNPIFRSNRHAFLPAKLETGTLGGQMYSFSTHSGISERLEALGHPRVQHLSCVTERVNPLLHLEMTRIFAVSQFSQRHEHS